MRSTFSELLKLSLCKMCGLTRTAESTFSELLKHFSNLLKVNDHFLCCETCRFADGVVVCVNVSEFHSRKNVIDLCPCPVSLPSRGIRGTLFDDDPQQNFRRNTPVKHALQEGGHCSGSSQQRQQQSPEQIPHLNLDPFK